MCETRSTGTVLQGCENPYPYPSEAIPVPGNTRCDLYPCHALVQPFWFAPIHHICIVPKNCQLAKYLWIPHFVVCCKAICIRPNTDLPLGLIKYSFVTSLATIFNPYDDATKAAFIGTLVILESLNFLDGRLLTTYGYLNFGTHGSVFIQDQGYHCEDNIQVYPHLLNYCLTPVFL